MKIETTTGSRIEQARNQLGLSCFQLASRISVESETLKDWERNRIEPRGEELMRLAGVLQVPMIWLLTGDTPKGSVRKPVAPGSDRVALKLERAFAMKQDLAVLLDEVSAEISALQQKSEEEEELVA